ncbi:MAG TPA: hypothetical protein VEI97_04360 [bacterium]|nr:hypothetical protein [bacterium]
MRPLFLPLLLVFALATAAWADIAPPRDRDRDQADASTPTRTTQPTLVIAGASALLLAGFWFVSRRAVTSDAS